MTTPAQRARIVDEAEAVSIINECLFGPTVAIKTARMVLKRCRKRSPAPFFSVQPAAPCPLVDVVLKPRPGPAPAAEPKHITPTAPLWQPSLHPGFLPGLCYLAAVQEHNVHEAVCVLGFYPTVFAIRNSPLIEQHCVFLILQRPGLYHVVTSWSHDTMTPLSAPGHYIVGAHVPRAGPSNFNQAPRAGLSGFNNMSWGRPMSPEGSHARPLTRGPPTAPAFGSRGPAPPREPLPPQNISVREAVRLDAGPPQKRNRGKGKGRNKFMPFVPYSTDPHVRRPSSPTTKWRAAIQDPLDDLMNGFRASTPRSSLRPPGANSWCDWEP